MTDYYAEVSRDPGLGGEWPWRACIYGQGGRALESSIFMSRRGAEKWAKRTIVSYRKHDGVRYRVEVDA